MGDRQPTPLLLPCTCLHAKNGFAVALQSSEEESIPCITNTNGTVIRPNNEQLSGAFLCCGKTANSPRAMAFEDFKSFIVLKNKPPLYEVKETQLVNVKIN